MNFDRSNPTSGVTRSAVTGVALVAITATLLSACSSKGGSSGGGAASAGATAATSAAAVADLDFYKGKTITWDVPSAPGASFYTSATILAPLVGKYLGATVNIVSIPAGATVAGQDQAAAGSKDGLTIGTLNVSANVSNTATKTPGINFDMTKVAFISGLPINPDVFVTSPTSQYQTWDSLAKAAPSVTATDYPGSIDILEKGIFGAYGIKAKLIAGYADVPSQVAGFLRGDAQFAINQVPGFASSIVAGKAKPLLVTAPIEPGQAGYAQLKDVPDIATYAAQNPPKTAQGQQAIAAMEALFGVKAVNQVFFAPQGTPPTVVAALSKAFESAQNDPTTTAAFVKANLATGFLSAADSTAAINTDVKLEGAIATAVSGYSG